MIGQITNAKHFITKKGDQMAVILLEDLVGIVEVVVFPGTYAKSGDAIRENEIVVVRGKAERDSDGAVRVLASKVTPIERVREFFLKQQNEREQEQN